VTVGPDAELVASPGNIAVPGVGARFPLAGTVAASANSTFWGAEGNLRTNLCCGPCYNVDAIAGYRYLGLDDHLNVSENIAGLGAATGFLFQSSDGFTTRNRFNGGQIGLDGEWRRNRWSVDCSAKFAFGNVNETAIVTGATSSSFLGAPLGGPASGGLLTVGRVGVYHRDRFAWSPDVGVNLGYQVTDHMRAFVGYDFLYLSDVARTGQQVDLRANSTLITPTPSGPANPPFAFHGTDFWAQGLSFGLEFRY
jgi:hypothetical protein